MKTLGWLLVFSAIGGAMAFIVEWGTSESARAADRQREADRQRRE